MIEHWRDIEFLHPLVLLGLLLIPLLIAWYIYRQKHKEPALNVSTLRGLIDQAVPARAVVWHGLFGLRMLALSAGIIALARPVIPNVESRTESEGIDIVIALDISSSMLARDFEPNRLEAAKEVAKSFIESRPNDRIGMVVFSGEAFTQCPITVDHNILTEFMGDIKPGLLKDGTAIGSGLGVAINRLQDSDVKSKVIILLTDGVNNAGNTDPMTAAELALNYNIRVYTVGVGKKGKAYSPVGIYPDGTYSYDYVEVQIDEDLLTQIAEETGGQYFRATDNESLQQVYDEIDQLEKSRVMVSSLARPIDLFFWLVVAAGGLLFLELLFRQTVVRSIT